MALPSEVRQIQREIEGLNDRLHDFDTSSKAAIEKDRRYMLTQLKWSVDSIEDTVEYLETGNSGLVRFLESNTTNNAQELTPKTVILQHLTDMDTRFAALEEAANVGLKRVKHIKNTGHDIHGELDALNAKLDSLDTWIERTRRAAQSMLRDKETEIERARDSLSSVRRELISLENDLETREEERDYMRVVGKALCLFDLTEAKRQVQARVATWGASLVFPIAGPTGLLLEIEASYKRKVRKRLRDEICLAQRTESSLCSRISTLSEEKAILLKAVKKAQYLQGRCDELGWTTEESRSFIIGRIREYQAIKESTDDFTAWANELKGQTEVMRSFGPTEAQLRKTARNIINSLLEQDDKDVRSICRRLKKLESSTSRRRFLIE